MGEANTQFTFFSAVLVTQQVVQCSGLKEKPDSAMFESQLNHLSTSY